jgi:hypothetical protein
VHGSPTGEASAADGIAVAPSCRRTYRGRVRHAGSEALDQLEPLLEELRRVPGLVERTRGVFSRRSRAFLHFHEDPSGLHADVRVGDDFERFRVQTPDERVRLLTLVRSI